MIHHGTTFRFQICPFPQFHLQSCLFAKHLKGEISLPTKTEMEKSLREEWAVHHQAGRKPRHFHKMGPLQWDYNRDIAALGATQPIPINVEKLYDAVHEKRQFHLMEYKNDAYKLMGDEFIQVENEILHFVIVLATLD